MITAVNSFRGRQYVQSFGCIRPVPEEEYPDRVNYYKLNKIETNDYELNLIKNDGDSFVFCLAKNPENLKESYRISSNIRKVESRILSNKSIADYDALLSTSELNDKSTLEGLVSNIYETDLKLLDGKPFTGVAKTVCGDEENFVKFKNGEMVLTYKRNLKKGFYGYTDEINKCSNYRVNTPNGFVFLSSKNDGEKDAVKLINFNMKKITNKDYFLSNCNGYNEIYKILTTDVKKYFGDSLDTVDYTFQ